MPLTCSLFVIYYFNRVLLFVYCYLLFRGNWLFICIDSGFPINIVTIIFITNIIIIKVVFFCSFCLFSGNFCLFFVTDNTKRNGIMSFNRQHKKSIKHLRSIVWYTRLWAQIFRTDINDIFLRQPYITLLFTIWTRHVLINVLYNLLYLEICEFKFIKWKIFKSKFTYT